MQRRPGSTLFPYTTLFRSGVVEERVELEGLHMEDLPVGTDPLLSVGPVYRGGTTNVFYLEEGSPAIDAGSTDRKSTRLNSSHSQISYAVFCLKKKTQQNNC